MTVTTRSLLLLAALALLPSISSAQSPENVCTKCHGALPERLGAPVALWRPSVHAQSGISCEGCHGGDPKSAGEAMSPARGFIGAPTEVEIPGFCGRCHPGVLKDYQASAHGKALGQGGPTCVTCHGNHGIAKASLDLINEKSCSRCHSYDRARTIKEAMRQTEAMIVGIEGRITGFQKVGADTDRMQKALFSARNSFHSLFHEVNVARVQGESGRINGELSRIDADLKALEKAHGERRLAGGFVVAGMLLIALLAHLLGKSLDR